MIEYVQILPPPDLRNVISFYWIGRKKAFAAQTPTYLLPDARIELLMNFRSSCLIRSEQEQTKVTAGSCTMTGSQTAPRWGECLDGTIECLGVIFQPGAFPFLDRSAKDCTDSIQPLPTGTGFDWVYGVLENFETPLAAIDPIERCLRQTAKRFSPPTDLKTALARLERSDGTERIGTICDDLGCSRQRMNRLFEQFIGVSPKKYSRLVRFHRVFQHLQLTPEPDWADTAIQFGYYDQAHLIQEFQEFTATTPAKFQMEEIFPVTELIDDTRKMDLIG